jgi:hypothetical protein
MVTITFHCPHCQSDALVRNGHAQSAQTAVSLPCVRASKPREPHSQRLSVSFAARRFCMPTKNASLLRGLTRTDCASRVRPCPVGSKKSSSASSLTYNPARPRSRGSYFHDAGTRRTVVLCAQKSERFLGVDRPVPQEATSGRLCGWGSEEKDVPAAVGEHCRQFSCWSLLHRLLGGLYGGDPARAAHSSGPARREKPPMSSVGIARSVNAWPALCA